MECSICGISGKMRSVFEVISPKGIILSCDKCASEEGFPVLKKPKSIFFEEPEKRSSVYERVARLSGIEPKGPEKPELKKQEESLRKIIDRNYEEKMRRGAMVLKPRQDLVDNFHWIIMRVRRIKGLTQKQLAEMIGESEAAIKMAEQGIVPEGYKLFDKFERFLGVKLVKEKNQKILQKPKKTLSFDKQSLDSLTIDDLKRMKTERELTKKEKYYETAEEANAEEESAGDTNKKDKI